MTSKEALEDFEAGRLQEAATKFCALLQQTPDSPSLLYNLGCTYQAMHQLEPAIEVLSRGLALDPTHLSIKNNLANALRQMGQLEPSIALFEQVLAVSPDRANTRLNYALALLSCGRYREGWAQYESRNQLIDYHRELRETRPEWNGDPALVKNGARVFVYCAQGLGDEIQCLRFLPILKALGAHVIFETQAPLFPMTKEAPGVDECCLRDGELPDFDYHVEIFSLPARLGISVENLPPPTPLSYEVDPNIVSIIERQRAQYPEKLHVGFSWTGNPGNNTNLRRSIAPAAFAHLEKLIGSDRIHFYGMQADHREGIHAGAVDLGAELKSFASTATALDRLDHVVTIDSALGHFAGNQCASASIMVHAIPDWRWALDRHTCPWYPSVRMHWQPEPGQWQPVIEDVAAHLQTLQPSAASSGS